ncbi:protein BIG GRAIN 1-like B [Cicer arietinum]|uniref:Protein BIG GRAIN 1-like B n=1 Tax=Cicer arietinum TaxID=3827 RepID=A0A1S2YV80_CICAR|nr:protein BIG GRAIN 1-like B [Cicer arietinum]
MEKWDKPSRDNRKQHQRENPSFSSTLLDVIYRSIDEGHHHKTEEKEEKLMFYKETTTMRNQKCVEAEKPNFRRTKKVENWMEKKGVEKVVMGRKSLTEFETRTRSNNSKTLSMHSSSSSSESSSAGGFSSSDSESFYGLQKPKPIRTSVSEKTTNIDGVPFHHSYNKNHSVQTQKPKNENGFGKTKSKALRILYGDLKKSKQPISPGARLASFLNSLFTSSGNTKKSKVTSSSSSSTTTTTKTTTNSVLEAMHDSKSTQASTCSSVSSFSRSCLSKTPSSRSGAKRSVRFCPVSVIVDEDCRPCGHKNLHEGEKGLVANNSSIYDGKRRSEELRLHVMQESRRVEELARDLLKNYQKKNGMDFNMQFENEEDDDDDDGASCSSSDLFELDNLSVIGIERYREELPVYETTHFNPSRGIANGFIM